MDKKSEANNIFMFMLTLAVVSIILLLGMMAVGSVMNFMADSEMSMFENKLREDINRVSLRKTSQEMTYSMPKKVSRIMLVDRAYREIILQNPLVVRNRIVYDSLESDEDANVFLFSKTGSFIKKLHVGNMEVGKFGDQACTGVGEIINTHNEIKIRITNKPGSRVMLGEECTEIRQAIFRSPFSQDLFPVGFTAAVITPNLQSIALAKSAMSGKYFQEANFSSPKFNINFQNRIDRIYYDALIIRDSKIRFRIGLEDTQGEWHYYGPDINATHEDEEGFFYTLNGEYIVLPDIEFVSVKVMIYISATKDGMDTPLLNWVKLTYFE
jgi:hypothetical protein